MGTTMLAIAVAMLMQAAVSSGAPPVATVPDWLRRPDSRDVERFFPKDLGKQNLAGRATINCQVTATGSLVNCSILSEDPAGAGFGEAALKMGGLFKMRPLTRDGKPVEGGTVRIPIRFALPPDAQVAPIPVRSSGFRGTVEVNCRYQDRKTDNCYVSESQNSSPAATEAAIALISGITLPATPRPSGRILVPIQFVAPSN